MKISIILISLFLVSSCAVDLEAARKSLSESKICCNSYKDMKFTDISSAPSHPFKINENSQSYYFDHKKSFFKAFNKTNDNELNFRLKTYLPQTSHVSATIFLPKIKTMNSKYVELRTLSPKLKYAKQGVDDWAGYYYYFDFVLKNNEKYFVIYTDPSYFGRSFKRYVSSTSYYVTTAAGQMIPQTTPGRYYDLPYAPVGKLEILVH